MVQIPRLREWREARALTQVELAERAGLSSRSVAGYEAGAGARPPTVRKLAEALGVEVTDLRGGPEHPLSEAPPSQQPTLNGALEEERRTAWESAVENARGLRESGQTRMTELLSLWRASRERQEEDDARREYRNEMADLLTQAQKAETDLFRNLSWSSSPEARRAYKEAKKAGAREVPNADWEEFREAAGFYYRLLGMVEGQQGLFVWQDSRQNAFEIVEKAA